MVVLNRIYTRTGDSGETALGTGERVSKASLRIEAYGTVDETNAAIGLVRLHTRDQHLAPLDAMLAHPDLAAGEQREVIEAYRMFANDRGWMRRIREAVHSETGMWLSFGGGASKLVAKLAAERAKPRPGTGATAMGVVASE